MTLRTSAAGGLSRFAHLTGLSRKKAEDAPAQTDDIEEVKDDLDDVKDDVEDVKDDLDETKDKVKELEEELDGKKDDDEPTDDKPAEQAAFRRGRVAGRKAERSRCAAIFSMPEASQNLPLAASLAFESRSSASEARSLLRAGVDGAPRAPAAAAAPSPKAGAGLDNRMSEKKPINVGTGAAAASGPDLSTPEGVATFVAASAAKARGQKK